MSDDKLGRKARCTQCRTVFVVRPIEGDAILDSRLSIDSAGSLAENSFGIEPIMPTAPEWEIGMIVFDDFRVEQHLGRGGMGDVYLVRSVKARQQFAAKCILGKWFQVESYRRNFLKELQTWIGLPKHPHLTTCHFFRTINDQVVLFAEYVSGGTLDSWISSGSLYTLEQILLVAIEFAWGLEVAHQLGIVHQDIKPLNVLMTLDGHPKVTDFGLARADRSQAEQDIGSPQPRGVTGSAGTPAYCSPEQANRKRLTPGTDLWSWGLSVLAMFIGGRHWSSGVAAAEVLEMQLDAAEDGDPEAFLVAPPPEVADVLRRCFQEDPADRYSTIAEAADELYSVYQQVAQDSAKGIRPGYQKPRGNHHFERRFIWGGTWHEPEYWLTRTYKLHRRDPALISQLMDDCTGARQAHLINDLVHYEDAYRLYARVPADRHSAKATEQAVFCMDKALIHGGLGDVSGMRSLLAEATDQLTQLKTTAQSEVTQQAAIRCEIFQAITAQILGNHQAAINWLDGVIQKCERVLASSPKSRTELNLAKAYRLKSRSLRLLDKASDAKLWSKKAEDLCQQWSQTTSRWEYANEAAACYAEQAALAGQSKSAGQLYATAIDIGQRLADRHSECEIEIQLARSYLGLAQSKKSNDIPRATKAATQAWEIYRGLFTESDFRELSLEMAECCAVKGECESSARSWHNAVESYTQAVDCYETIVSETGQGDAVRDLAISYQGQAQALESVRQDALAGPAYESAIDLLEGQVVNFGFSEMGRILAELHSRYAAVLDRLGQKELAKAHRFRASDFA